MFDIFVLLGVSVMCLSCLKKDAFMYLLGKHQGVSVRMLLMFPSTS